jgi:tRNA modification GTPase
LLNHVPLGWHLTQPWRVAVAGAPNVGKSSLVNALAGYQRAVVTPIVGTTRDLVTTAIALEGWPVELTDSAGLRGTGESLEAEGVRRAERAASDADLCVWVLDGSTRDPLWPHPNLARVLLVVNKADLPAAWDPTGAAGATVVSATTRAGLDVLCRRIAERLVPSPPAAGAAVPFSEPIISQIAAARAALRRGDATGATECLTA